MAINSLNYAGSMILNQSVQALKSQMTVLQSQLTTGNKSTTYAGKCCRCSADLRRTLSASQSAKAPLMRQSPLYSCKATSPTPTVPNSYTDSLRGVSVGRTA